MEAFYKNIAAKLRQSTMGNQNGSETQTTRGNLEDTIEKKVLKKPDNCKSADSTPLSSCRTSFVDSRRPSRDHTPERPSRRPSLDQRSDMSGNFILSSPDSPMNSGRGDGISNNLNVALLRAALQTLNNNIDNLDNNNSSNNTSKLIQNASIGRRAIRSGIQ